MQSRWITTLVYRLLFAAVFAIAASLVALGQTAVPDDNWSKFRGRGLAWSMTTRRCPRRGAGPRT